MSAHPHSQETLRIGAVLLAAGRGTRMASAEPKQFLLLGGVPVFVHSLRLFDTLEGIARLVLVTPDGGLPGAHEGWLAGLRHERMMVAGGARRQDSVAAGLMALAGAVDIALVHDTARPFPPAEAVARLVERTMVCGGGLLAARCVDTVKRAHPDDTVAETIDRSAIWLAQTPQAIRGDLIARAIEELQRPDLEVTDEASLLERLGVSVALVESPATNFKITTPDDLARAEALLAARAAAVG